jgi:hypothetical protein
MRSTGYHRRNAGQLLRVLSKFTLTYRAIISTTRTDATHPSVSSCSWKRCGIWLETDENAKGRRTQRKVRQRSSSCVGWRKASKEIADSAVFGAPERIRTSDLCLRRATLYPAELRALGAPRLDRRSPAQRQRARRRRAARLCGEARRFREGAWAWPTPPRTFRLS